MKIKIISKDRYETLIRLLKESVSIVKSLEKDRNDYLEQCVNLREENLRLKELLHKNGICYLKTNIDFPATTKLHEDKKLF